MRTQTESSGTPGVSLRVAGAALSALLAVSLLCSSAVMGQAAGGASAPATSSVGDVSGGPPSGGPAPALQDSAFDARTASNFSEVEKVYGPFTDEQVARLDRDRFLLVPRVPEAKSEFFRENSFLYDEMLARFDMMGGPDFESERSPEHARFIGPDVVLHAFHKYFSERLKEVEKNVLPQLVGSMLLGTYENALALRSQAPEGARPAWDLAIAQMAVPLVLIETRAPRPAVLMEPEQEGLDTLEAALSNFAEREGDLPEPLRESVRSALRRVFETPGAGVQPAPGSPGSVVVPGQGARPTDAETSVPAADAGPDPAGALGLVPAYNADSADWTQFVPRAHYSESSASRAYFRATVWLGQLGWPRDDPGSLPAVVCWSAALSGPGGEGFRKAAAAIAGDGQKAPESPLGAWRAVMDITSFFAGFPADPSLQEAMEAVSDGPDGTAPGAGSPGDAAFLSELAPRMAAVSPKAAGIAALREGAYAGKGVVTVFPQRLTVPWLIASELTAEKARPAGQGASARRLTDLPNLFSGLYLAYALGSPYAGGLLERQLAEYRDWQEPAPGTPDRVLGLRLRALEARAREIRESMGRLTDSDWNVSFASAWFCALRSFSRVYGEGYPLYMQGSAFGARQLETLLGSFTELKHDSVLYEKPNYAEFGGNDDEARPRRLPKGFVEPNLEFWDRMTAAVGAVEAGFRRNGLFPGHLEEYGKLAEFGSAVSRLSGIARQELAGTAVSDEDYEFVRTFRLEEMAERDTEWGDEGSETDLSGLVVDIQTVLPSGDEPGGVLHEALGPPSVMLVLVGNDGDRRIVVGVAYNHFEFIVRGMRRLSDPAWKAAAYQGLDTGVNFSSPPDPALPGLPPKPFWYGPTLE
ncbi:MAG: DUF3160 domain-containing protein [Deltaproteobacteria bacterium]|nr:DUF3160 domain-containing protein [Deltaproteobacteria bacterium]